MINQLKLGGLALLMATGGAAQALTVSYNSNVIGLTTTNFGNMLSFTQFNPSLGTLSSILVTLNGNIAGFARAESLDNAASTIVLNLAGTLSLTRPDNSLIVVTAPLVSSSFAASQFDGSIDFAGTSGIAFNNLTASDSDSATLTSASDLALFTGLGMLSAPLLAAGGSSASGSGNLVTQFGLAAGASGTVTYTYTVPGVPEPATWGLLIAGFVMTGVSMRRRKAVLS